MECVPLFETWSTSKFSNFGEVSHLLEKKVADFLGVKENNTVTWFWIGSHSDYDKLLDSF